MMKRTSLRGTLITGGCLTLIGAIIRVVAAANRDSLGASWAYAMFMLGQSFGAIAQPMFNTLPAAIAASWFPVNERDIATTISSLFNPLGNAVGQVLPPIFVSDNNGNIEG